MRITQTLATGSADRSTSKIGAIAGPGNSNLTIEWVSIQRLRPDPRNTRLHSRRHIRQIGDSLKVFGWRVPLLADPDGQIISGHARLEACKLLGFDQAPVIRVANLSETQVRAFMIADNRLCETGGWNERLLGETLRDLSLQNLDFDLEVIGFTMAEIDLKIEGLETAGDEDTAEEPPPAGPPVTQPGHLWTLGPHRLLCADALAAESYSTLMGDERAAIVFTDPPYNVRIRDNVSGKGKVKHGDFAVASGEMTEAQFTTFLIDALGRCAEWSRPGSLHYVCMDWRHLHELIVAGRRHYAELKNLCVWAKSQPGQGSLYRSQHELVAVFKKGGGDHRNNIQLGRFGRNRSNLWSYPSPSAFGRAGEEGSLLADHPTPKPVAMVADALMDASARGDIVLDPFLGGGATLAAAERVGRVCRGMEIDPLYADAAVRRWQRLTGEDALRTSDGRSFSQIEAEARDDLR